MFSSTFVHEALPSRVLFGRGTLVRLPEEAERLGIHRALVLTGPQKARQGEQVQALLGNVGAGLFTGARMHTGASVGR